MNVPQKARRDYGLDVLKGIACVLMVFVHARTVGKTIDTPFTLVFWYIGFFAPVLFLFSIGISLLYQVKTKILRSILLSYIFLFLFSFADVGAMSAHYFNFSFTNLFGSIALAALCSLAIYTYAGVRWYLCLLPMGIGRVLQYIGVPHTLLFGSLFGVFPWMSFILFGMYFKQYPRVGTLIACIFGLIAGIFVFVFGRHVVTEDATFLYLSLGFFFSFVYWLIAKIFVRWKILRWGLGYLGQRSLLFYWLHLFLLYRFPYKCIAPIVWIGVLLITIIAMEILKRLNQYLAPYAQHHIFWLLMVAGVCIPMLIHMTSHHQYVWMNAILLLFALNYHFLSFGQPTMRHNGSLP